jgi:hypothetical protein
LRSSVDGFFYFGVPEKFPGSLRGLAARGKPALLLTLLFYAVCRPRWCHNCRQLGCTATTKNGGDMVDQWVRLGMAIAIIALISISLYQFGGRASAVEPSLPGIAYKP